MTKANQQRLARALLKLRAQQKTRAQIAKDVMQRAAASGRPVKASTITAAVWAAHKRGMLAPTR